MFAWEFIIPNGTQTGRVVHYKFMTTSLKSIVGVNTGVSKWPV